LVSIEADLPLPNPPLRGAAFVLRPFRADDIVGAEEFAADPASARWVPALPAVDGEGVALYYDEARAAGEMLLLVIADPTTDAYLGEVVLVPGEHRVAELGCGVRPSARGRGLGSAALRALADWALTAAPSGLGLGRVQVLVAVENEPALALSEAAGFRREAVLRRYWEIDGERLDVVVLARFPGAGP
jgi:RimJ/RimL family protein N-acetyltransferase